MVSVLDYRPSTIRASKRRISFTGEQSSSSMAIHHEDDLWFPESTMDYPLERIKIHPSLSVDEDMKSFLSLVDSMDEAEIPNLGISLDGLAGGVSNLLTAGKDIILFSSKLNGVEQPKTPTTTKPVFTELPPIISSPDTYLNSDDDSLELIDEAFQPPGEARKKKAKKASKKKSKRKAKKKVTKNVLKKANVSPPSPRRPSQQPKPFDALLRCMQRSHSSRREILRRQSAFGNHPALIELERFDESQRRLVDFLTVGQDDQYFQSV